MLAIWSGVPQSTADILVALVRWKEGNPLLYNNCINELSLISRECTRNIKHADTTDFIGNIIRYDSTLEKLSSLSGLGFYNQVHKKMRDRASKAGLAYKPSGAGGGDFGIAFSDELSLLEKHKETLSAEGAYTFFL